MDEDDLAFKEKQRAGTYCPSPCPGGTSYCWHKSRRLMCIRCEGQQGNGREGKGQRTAQCRSAGNQEVGEEINFSELLRVTHLNIMKTNF